MKRPHAPAALHQRNNRALVFWSPRAARIIWATFTVRRDARLFGFAVIGLIGFHNRAAATQRAYVASIAHGLADAMRHEPCCLVTDIQGAVQLVSRDAL